MEQIVCSLHCSISLLLPYFLALYFLVLFFPWYLSSELDFILFSLLLLIMSQITRALKTALVGMAFDSHQLTLQNLPRL